VTDLEIVQKCAEAMGLACYVDSYGDLCLPDVDHDGDNYIYNPLRDDAQAMALVKRFKADICWALDSSGNDGLWFVDIGDTTSEGYADRDADLNRAICLVVAKMQAAK